MNYVAKITWEYGTSVVKHFKTEEERELFLDKNEDIISSVTVFHAGEDENFILNILSPANSLYSIDREWTDEEMDLLL